MKTPALILPMVASAAAFTGTPLVSRSASASHSNLYMGGARGGATTMEGKIKTVEKVQGLLESSEMIFTIPGGSMSVAETQTLRKSLPESTTMMTVKNALMNRAVAGTDYEVATSMLKGPNTWFFIEEDIGGTIKAYKSFVKDAGKKESHPIAGGVVEGIEYDSAGIEAIGKLPSKMELIAQIAGSIKAVPTKVARVIKAPNSKLARAIKLATMPEDDE
mmetsp:Transcript_298/g.304  ORF Transcript_298/g.304 Transcript_298/m.304 type:complete len:219 (+) Transcript_298:64-720(+)|eukprot:CAMPEP_0195266478 /NCGR_PEP_ID=MMETSP0706-20130129/12033_1 /TAXON_ID=33640 /ORGANISM="Asterionellopsis glacialis, Strain CCMP134" /LENGTH=218 /DNA_ID=CAMNT_0040321075 /DNA_START=46 /DNA_END=702 /DNA_ORIENTATION=-